MLPQKNIGRAELEILNYINNRHPVTVREVADHFAATKGHTRTTILNVMERLRIKRFLTRRKIDGFYQYSPRLPKAALLQRLVRDFVERALEGSLAPFVAYLVEEADLTPAELSQLKELVRDLEPPPGRSPK